MELEPLPEVARRLLEKERGAPAPLTPQTADRLLHRIGHSVGAPMAAGASLGTVGAVVGAGVALAVAGALSVRWAATHEEKQPEPNTEQRRVVEPDTLRAEQTLLDAARTALMESKPQD